MSFEQLRPLLFMLEPERAHQLSIAALEALGRMPKTLKHLATHYRIEDARFSQNIWGLCFPNPVGLAAGYDKDARAVAALSGLGFGFIEIGTVTPRPQAGNARPRVFRYPASEAVINRMGFPGEGAETVAGRLAALDRHPVPLGINIGKNKDTPLEHAADDYVTALRYLFPYGDYLVVNVSSPNTPGLRRLQSTDAVVRLLDAIGTANRLLAHQYARTPLPLLLKIAPDLAPQEIIALAELGKAPSARVDGFIATNTTIDRPAAHPEYREAGGLSGAPLRERSTAVIADLYRATEGRVPIIGSGGILSAADAYAKICAGASLVQIYTGLIFRGPALIREIVTTLPELCRRDGYADPVAARGSRT